MALVQQPLHGTLTLNPDGSYTYVPDAGFAGRDRAVYRLTRQASQTRVSEGTMELYIFPDAASLTASPSTLKGGSLVTFTATVTARVNYNMQCGFFTNSQYIPTPTSIYILKDRNYGTMRVSTVPVTSTVNVEANFYCGRTSKVTTVTLTP